MQRPPPQQQQPGPYPPAAANGQPRPPMSGQPQNYAGPAQQQMMPPAGFRPPMQQQQQVPMQQQHQQAPYSMQQQPPPMQMQQQPPPMQIQQPLHFQLQRPTHFVGGPVQPSPSQSVLASTVPSPAYSGVPSAAVVPGLPRQQQPFQPSFQQQQSPLPHMQQQQHPHVQQPQPPQQFVQATQQPTPVHAETDPGAGLATGSAKRRVYPSQQLPLQQTMHAQQPQLQTQQQQPQQQQPALLAPNPAIAQLQSLTNERAGEPDRNLSESQTSLFSSMNGINEFSSRFANNTPVAQGGVPPAVPLIGHRPPVEELSWPSVPPATSAQFMCTPESGVLCPASYKRCTINAIPQTPSLLSKSRIPFGMILHPFKAVDDGEVVPVLGATSRADPGHPVYEASTIVRCRRCRTYINPFVQFTDTAHWRCNICFLVNDLPANFLYNPQTQQKVFRPEISHGIVEYIAPADYMVRPPQPPVFVFVVDVSVNAVNSGMLETFAKVLANSLDSIPNADLRARIAFITFDSAIHFYHLTDDATELKMMAVADLEEVFLPMPENLLVNLNECRTTIDSFLETFGRMFKNTTNNYSAMGPAMEAALKLGTPMGGKIIVVSATLPNIGDGQLKARDDIKALGTSGESTLLQPASGFYKSFAVSCSKAQVSVDMFLFGTHYLDVASLICTPRFTAGSVYFYPGFNAGRSEDVVKFASEFNHYLGRPMGQEAVLRMRATRGIKCEAFHGNFFIRSSDLLALPTVSPDNSYAFQLTLDENLAVPVACFQTAMLYTASHGERRIRIMTISLPVTTDMGTLYRNIDQRAVVVLLTKMAVERAITARLEDARDALVNKCVDMLGVYKASFASPGANPQLLACDNLKLLPLMTLSIIKCRALRGGSQTPLDVRSYAFCLLRILSTGTLIKYIHPSLYELYLMGPEVGLPARLADGEPPSPTPSGQIVMPIAVNLASERLVSHGLYLLDAGDMLMMWVGRAAPPAMIQDVFDRPSLEALDSGKFALPVTDSPFNRRIHNIIGKIRERIERRNFYPELYLVKEEGGNPMLKLLFLSFMVEDRHDFAPSYAQFLNEIKERVNKSSF